MPRAPAQQSFHWVLTTGLLASLFLLGIGLALASAARSAPILFLIFGLAGVLQVVTVPTAVILLVKGGYRTAGNVIVTLLALVPLLFILLVAWTFFFGHWHM